MAAKKIPSDSDARRRELVKLIDRLADDSRPLEACIDLAAEQLFVHRRTVQKWLYGERAVSPRTLAQARQMLRPEDTIN